MNKLFLFLSFLVAVFASTSCTDNQLGEPQVATPYTLEVPAGFPEPTIPEDNPMTKEGVALGRLLYYDSILHQNQVTACATCHIQSNSFSSAGPVLPHINLAWSNSFLWDGAEEGALENAMLFEVEEFFETDVSKLQEDENYPQLFEQAFGSKEISTKRISDALAQFIRTLNSGNSKFDQYIQGKVDFTDQEARGFDLFFTEKGDCFHCHATVFFTDNQMHNNALDSLPEVGRFKVTGDSLDIGKYKSPTLRNIEFTGPYMHDGRYETLEEVIDFYSEGLEYSPTVDPLMKNLNQGGVQLTSEEKAALLAFLKTLSEPEYLTNPSFSQPEKP